MKLLLRWILLPVLALGLLACGSDSNPTKTDDKSDNSDEWTDREIADELVGTWVAFQGRQDGQYEPDGGTYGTAGTVMHVRADGTGDLADISNLGVPDPFTWSVLDGVLDVESSRWGEETISLLFEGDVLTTTALSSPDFSTLWQRHEGAPSLNGRWRFFSVMDDYYGIEVDDDPHTMQFPGDGTVIIQYDGEDPRTMDLHVDGVTVRFGNSMSEFVYNVRGNTFELYLYYQDTDPYDPQETIDVMLIFGFEAY